MNSAKILQIKAWSLTVLSTALAVGAWGQSVGWHIVHISIYKLFPVFGLLAFSIMWSHYIAAAVRQWLGVDKTKLHRYFEATSYAVLTCILLHPGLLIYKLFRDGAGLPPESYLHYVRPGLQYAVLLGSVSFLIFIAYEFRRIYGKKTWWKYVQYASDLAMFLIVIHGLKLGNQLGPGWFQKVWWFYAVSLMVALLYMYIQKNKSRRTA